PRGPAHQRRGPGPNLGPADRVTGVDEMTVDAPMRTTNPAAAPPDGAAAQVGATALPGGSPAPGNREPVAIPVGPGQAAAPSGAIAVRDLQVWYGGFRAVRD